MKKIFLLFVVLGLVSCGETETVIVKGEKGNDGSSCYISGTLLICGGDSFDLSDLRGADGLDGLDGKDGETFYCDFEELETGCLEIKCDGRDVVLYCPECSCECDECEECEDNPKPKCNNGNGNGSEGCSPSPNGNDDE